MISGNQNSENSNVNPQYHNPLGLSDEQYWNDPASLVSDIISDRMFAEKDGFLIGCPQKVFLDKHHTVPMLCIHTAETNKFVRHTLTTTTQLVSVCLETGDVQLVKLAPSPAIKDTRNHPPGFSSRKLVVDLKKMGVISTIGRYTTLLLSGSENSNQQIVEIIPDSDKKSIDNYQISIASYRQTGTELPVKDAYNELLIQSHDNQNTKNIANYFNIKQTPEGKSEFRINMDFKISGLPRFLYKEKLPISPDKKQIFAALPIAIIGFNEERILIINERFAIPITIPITGTEECPVFSGNVSFPLSALLPNGFTGKKVALWCISMEYFSLVEIET